MNNEVLNPMVNQMIWKKSAHMASYMYMIDKRFLLVKMLNAVTLSINNLCRKFLRKLLLMFVSKETQICESIYSSHTLIIIEMISDLEKSLHASLKHYMGDSTVMDVTSRNNFYLLH